MTSLSSLLPDVSRETQERLTIYVALLRKWNPTINLVAKSTLGDIWSRHVLDSAQVYRFLPETAQHWADFGSGAGFPGMVVAMISKEKSPDLKVTLVESDIRKATFLRTVLRETGTKANVISQRIEALAPLNADVISARALADLKTLLTLAQPHLSANGQCLFQKGESWKKELQDTQSEWSFSLNSHTSTSEQNSVVLQIGDLVHV